MRVDLERMGIELPIYAEGEMRVHCPHCGKGAADRTLGVDVDRGVFHCFRCGWKGRVGASGNVTPIFQARIKRDEPRKRLAIQRVLSECVPLKRSDPVKDYLYNRLGEIPEADLLAHPKLPYFDSSTGEKKASFPAMIGVIRNPEGEVVSLHRTYVKGGAKAPVHSPRKIMSPPVPRGITGGAVRLYEAEDTLILTEGIETGLAAFLALREPVWSCLSAYGLKTVKLPRRVRHAIICADNDSNGVGQEAGYVLRKRLLREGRGVKLLIPDKPDTDWLDVHGEEK